MRNHKTLRAFSQQKYPHIKELQYRVGMNQQSSRNRHQVVVIEVGGGVGKCALPAALFERVEGLEYYFCRAFV